MAGKTIYYSLNPKYFKDGNNDGIGDLIGLARQVEYFNYLGVDVVILQDIFTKKNLHEPFLHLKKTLGTKDEFIKVINYFHKYNLRICIELPFDILKPNYLWLKKAEDVATDFSTRELYLLEELTSEISLNSNQTVLTNLLEIINYWRKLNVDGFVIKNFEYLGDKHKHEILNHRTLELLSELYSRVKVLHKNCLWIGLAEKLVYEQITHLTRYPLMLFDEVMSYEVGLIGTTKNLPNDGLGKFSPKKLAHNLRKIINNDKSMLTFGIPYSGRITSRWGNDLSYWKESSKCLAMLLHLNKANPNILFGDEMGLPNLNHETVNRFQAINNPEQTRTLQAKGIDLSRIQHGQFSHHHIHNQQIIPWNNQIYGGFTKSAPHKILLHHLFDEINIANQFKDRHSILDFNQKLIKWTKGSFFNKIFNHGTFKIQVKTNGIIVIKGQDNLDKFNAYINFSPSSKKLFSHVVFLKRPIFLSTYSTKKYQKVPRKLNPYEGIMLLRTAQDYTKDRINVLVRKKETSSR